MGLVAVNDTEGMYHISGCMAMAARLRVPYGMYSDDFIEWTISFAGRVIDGYLNGYHVFSVEPEEGSECFEMWYEDDLEEGWFEDGGAGCLSVSEYRVNTVVDEDDYTLSLWNPDDASDDSAGVVIVSSGDMHNGVLCNDGMGRDEANAICRNQGYRYGQVVDPYDFNNMNERNDPFHGYMFVATDVECEPDSDGNIRYDCSYTEYAEASTPCEEGEVLALRCADTQFEIGTTLTVKNKNSGRTRFQCEVEAEKYGMDYDVKHNVHAVLMSRDQYGSYTVLDDDMNHKKTKFRAKMRTSEIHSQCYVCMAAVRDTMVFSVAVHDGYCDYEMDQMDVFSEILQWMLSGAE